MLSAWPVSESHFYAVRAWTASCPAEWTNALERAARTVYSTGSASTLYRVNASGQFNVSYGKYANPTVCDEDNIE